MKIVSPGEQIRDVRAGEGFVPSWAKFLSGNTDELQKALVEELRKEMLGEIDRLAQPRTTATTAMDIAHPAPMLRKFDTALRRLVGLRGEHRSLLLQLMQFEDSVTDLRTELAFAESPEHKAFLATRLQQALDLKSNREQSLGNQVGRGAALRAQPAHAAKTSSLAAKAQAHYAKISTAGNNAMAQHDDGTWPILGSGPLPVFLPTVKSEISMETDLLDRFATISYFFSALQEARGLIGVEQMAVDLDLREREATASVIAADGTVAAVLNDHRAHEQRVRQLKTQVSRLDERRNYFAFDYDRRIAQTLKAYAKTAYELEDLSVELGRSMRALGFSAPDFKAAALVDVKNDSADDAYLSQVGDELRRAEDAWERMDERGIRTLVVHKGIVLEAGKSDTNVLTGTCAIEKFLAGMRIEAVALVGSEEETANLSLAVKTSVGTKSGLGIVSYEDGKPARLQWPTRVVTQAAAPNALSPAAGPFLINLQPGNQLRIQVSAAGRTSVVVDVYFQILGIPIEIVAPSNLS